MIEQVIERLSSGAGLEQVRGAVDFANIMANNFNVPFDKRPAAFVMMLNETPAESGELDTGGIAQRVQQSIEIIFCLGDGTTADKAVAKDAIKAVRDAVLDRLLAWSPDGLGVFFYGGLGLLPFRPRAVWFRMVFSRHVGVSG